MSETYDVVVIGAGMVGATSAALLSRAGLHVAVVEAHEPAPFDPDSEIDLRVSALAPGSRAILHEAGAWKLIERQRHCDYRRMVVVEQGASGTTGDSLGGIEFEAGEYGLDSLGSIVENRLIQASLWQVLQGGMAELCCPAKLAHISQDDAGAVVTLKDSRELATKLVLGADGANSRVRKFADVALDTWEYNQRGVVAVVTTEQPNTGEAWQRFLPGGPLAFLPLADGRSSIVWTLPVAEAEDVLALDEELFRMRLEDASAGHFGRVSACGPRAAFPLTMQLSDSYVDGRIVLLGDAAHVVHPLAGQGVNLGLMDAAALVEVLLAARAAGKPIDGSRTLRRFERWRVSDNHLMARGIDALQQAYALPGPLASLRRIGVSLVDRSWTLKSRFIAHATGQWDDAPQLARGTSLRSLAHP